MAFAIHSVLVWEEKKNENLIAVLTVLSFSCLHKKIAVIIKMNLKYLIGNKIFVE